VYRLLAAAALGLGAALLFLIQPLATKRLLPAWGGVPTVWTAALVFFQACLLLGYLYAHFLARRLHPRSQVALHLALGIPAALLVWGGRPIGTLAAGPPPDAAPDPWQVLAALGLSLAPTMIWLSSTGPLLQRWFADRSPHADPYPLFIASNAGSLLGLLAYPFFLEPRWTLADQASIWGSLVLALLALVALIGLRPPHPHPGPAATPANPSTPPRSAAVLRWLCLSAVTSCLLAGLTIHLTTDLAPVPLLWVLPLSLYLITWMMVFGPRGPELAAVSTRLFPWAVLALLPVLLSGVVHAYWIPLHLVVFLITCWMCHGEVAATRPDPRHLTLYYLAMALGGLLGTAFSALLAPMVCDRMVEYPLALVLACAALPGLRQAWHNPRSRRRDLLLALAIGGSAAAALAAANHAPPLLALAIPLLALACGLGFLVVLRHRIWPLAFFLSLAAVLAVSLFIDGPAGRTVWRHRSFLGCLHVARQDQAQSVRLVHGSTLHGEQSLDPNLRREPRTYYSRQGPVGDVFSMIRPLLRDRDAAIAVIGLGVGTLAAYALPGERWVFYELDPAVAAVAHDQRWFHYLADSPAHSTQIILGDARRRIQNAPDHAYGLIVIDAFSSDVVPVHLLTREALNIYRAKLAPGGLILANLSNRYLDLEQVLATLARSAGLACKIRRDVDVTPEMRKAQFTGSIWGVIAERDEHLGPILQDRRWRAVPPGGRPWSDDFVDLARHIRLSIKPDAADQNPANPNTNTISPISNPRGDRSANPLR
jgi:SAM-dependent methyltransferase